VRSDSCVLYPGQAKPSEARCKQADKQSNSHHDDVDDADDADNVDNDDDDVDDVDDVDDDYVDDDDFIGDLKCDKKLLIP
jgi:hypothetical protein